jgi:hypothetical protein
MIDVPLLIEFAPQTSLYRERDLVSPNHGALGSIVAASRADEEI